jgi:transposase InsO family protein
VVLQVAGAATDASPGAPGATRRRRQASFDESEATYGSPRILEDLREWGWAVSKKSIEASMARQGLVARPKKRFRSLTRADNAAPPAPDLVGRDFSAEAINEKWCGDLTRFPPRRASCTSPPSRTWPARRVPGFAIDDHHDATLAAGALKMAAAMRGGDVSGVIFHSDRGSEYTADLFEVACAALGVTQSMSRVGSALDNAAAESFFSTLEFECLSKHRFATKAEARRAVARYIDRYNRIRRHSSCEMKSPTTKRSWPTGQPRAPKTRRRREKRPLRASYRPSKHLAG